MRVTHRSKVLLLADDDPSHLPLFHALTRLGLSADHVPVAQDPLPYSEDVCAVFVISGRSTSSDPEETISRILRTSDVPVFLVSDDQTTNSAGQRPPLSGAVRIPADLSSELLEWTLAQTLEAQSVQRQLHHYRMLLESAPVGVFEIVDGKLVYANPYLLERMGKPSAASEDRQLVEFFAPEDRERFLEALQTLPTESADAQPHVYRFVTSQGDILVGEVRSRIAPVGNTTRIEGTIRDITHETRIQHLHRIVLEMTEVILSEQDTDRILQLVLDTIVEYSGFRRALLSLYDLSIPVPFEGPISKILVSGLTPEQANAVTSQDPIPFEHRRLIFSDRFRLGPAYYIPHDQTPWAEPHGIAGTVEIDGWHPDDFLFIPLRGVGGIIGSISVDDPVDQSAPTASSIEPVAFLANLAAFAVERTFKLQRMQKQAMQLHELATLGPELIRVSNERSLCEIAVERVHASMNYGVCGVYLLDGMRLVHEAVACHGGFSEIEVPAKGHRTAAEGPGINRWVLKHGVPAIIPDVAQEPRYDGTRETVKSYLAVPIIGRKGTIGVFYAASQRLAGFGDQDLEMLSTLASYLATALSALRRRSDLNRIFAFGQHLAVASTAQQAISSTLDFLVEQFDFQLSSILLLQDDGSLRMEACGGAYSTTHLRKGWITSTDTGIVGWAARNNRSIVVPDVSKDTRYHDVFAGTRSELAVPILLNERLLGVINIESPRLHFFDDEDRQLIEVVANHLAIALANIASQEDLREQAIRDPLTGLFNRHYFNSIIASEFTRSDRYKHPLALMMIDVDGFRVVNNQLGHLMGDEILQNVARLLESGVRDSDRVIRYGGDEFLIFMPETNGQGDSERISQRLRQGVASVLEGTGADELGLTLGLSIGIYSRQPGEDRTLEEILEEVDRRMYADKRTRNQDHADDYRR
jgi:diguanylate cyclase (GGDEF)-like protein/PAS domain S-box-containing protein